MPVYEDEIDLRPYILAVTRNWWKIGAIAVGLALVGLIVSLLIPRTYGATASGLLTRQRPELTLAKDYPTVQEAIDMKSRIDSIINIGNSDATAAQVMDSLNVQGIKVDHLKELKDSITIENKGDLILITASRPDPQEATKIANAWIQVLVTSVNQAYSGDLSLEQVQAQVSSAQQDYQKAQSDYENYLKTSPIDLLQQKVDESKALLQALGGDRIQQLNANLQRKQDMDSLIVQAEGLKKQLASGTRSSAGSAGDALAVMFARARALGIIQQVMQSSTTGNTTSDNATSTPEASTTTSQREGLNMSIQINDLPTLKDTNTNYAADLDSLIQQAKAEKTLAEANLANLTRTINEGQGYETIQQTTVNLANLTAQLETAKAELQQLTTQRDTTFSTYQALLEKKSEIQSGPKTSLTLAPASQAIIPTEPASRGTVRNIILAGILGLVVGTLWFLVSFWLRNLNLQPKPAVAD